MLRESEDHLAKEHLAVCRHWGAMQARCSAAMAEQAAQVESLQAQVVRLRAAVIVRDTRLAMAAQDVERLARDGVRWRWQALQQALPVRGDGELLADPVGGGSCEAWVRQAADLVICQTGCVGQGLPWQQQDQCLRSGQTCVLASPAPSPPVASPEPVPAGPAPGRGLP